MTIVIAHRGASHAARENTLTAFRKASEMRADWVELDVRRTQDGALAIHHDAHLADGRILCDVTADELPPYVPNLASALDACSAMGVNIEIKNWPSEPDFDPDNTLADKVVALLASRGNADRVLISAFHLPLIDRVRELSPNTVTAWLVERFDTETLDILAAHGHHVVHPWVKKVTRDLIEQCHNRQIVVNAWTCDDPARMSELIDWGIDGICTNVPDVARALLPLTD